LAFLQFPGEQSVNSGSSVTGASVAESVVDVAVAVDVDGLVDADVLVAVVVAVERHFPLSRINKAVQLVHVASVSEA
jgi:hypothetical protein